MKKEKLVEKSRALLLDITKEPSWLSYKDLAELAKQNNVGSTGLKFIKDNLMNTKKINKKKYWTLKTDITKTDYINVATAIQEQSKKTIEKAAIKKQQQELINNMPKLSISPPEEMKANHTPIGLGVKDNSLDSKEVEIGYESECPKAQVENYMEVINTLTQKLINEREVSAAQLALIETYRQYNEKDKVLLENTSDLKYLKVHLESVDKELQDLSTNFSKYLSLRSPIKKKSWFKRLLRK
jgi:hypothetical protein